MGQHTQHRSAGASTTGRAVLTGAAAVALLGAGAGAASAAELPELPGTNSGSTDFMSETQSGIPGVGGSDLASGMEMAPELSMDTPAS